MRHTPPAPRLCVSTRVSVRSRTESLPLLRALGVLMGLATALGSATTARANPESPSVYDARVMGMGGAVGATIDSPAAIYHNPAGLALMDRSELTLALTGLVVFFDSPFAGAGSEQTSGPKFGPLGFLGAAFPVHERVTLGVGAYLTTSFGGIFDNIPRFGDCRGVPDDVSPTDPDVEVVSGEPDGNNGLVVGADGQCFIPDSPQDQRLFVFVMELGIPVAIEVTDRFRIGVSLRIPYGVQSVETTQPTLGAFQRVEQQLRGFGLPGVLIGMQWDPLDELALSLVYRSRTSVHMTGTSYIDLNEVEDGVAVTSPVRSSTDFAQPDMLRFGVAGRLLDRRLTIATEMRVQFHKAVNESQDFTVQFPIGMRTIPVTVTQPLDWRNALVFTIGAEYQLETGFAFRLGFNTGRGATPRHTLTAYTPLPSGQFGAFVGAGYHHERFDVDLAAGYGGGRAHTITEEFETCTNPGMNSAVGCPGRYEIDTIFLSLSTRVRL